MAINGVPAFGPQEADSNNAVNGNGVPGARFWYGHAGGATWHVHNPQMGKKQFHPTSFLVMPWMGFQFMALLTMTRYLNWIRAMEFITTMEVISIMFQELIRLMETSSIEYCNIINSPNTTNWN